MKAEYGMILKDVMLELGKLSLVCFTLDGATNVQGKQKQLILK